MGVLAVLRLALTPRKGTKPSKPVATALEFTDSVLIALAAVFFIIRPFIVQSFLIPSGSMEPTLRTGDRVLTLKFLYHFRDPKPGEVVVFEAPEQARRGPGDRKDFIKRVVARGDDVVEVRQGRTYVNGRVRQEPYTREPPNYRFSPHEVASRSLFMMGDNRNQSNDSRMWGDLRENKVLGKAVLIFWPPSRMGRIH